MGAEGKAGKVYSIQALGLFITNDALLMIIRKAVALALQNEFLTPLIQL